MFFIQLFRAALLPLSQHRLAPFLKKKKKLSFLLLIVTFTHQTSSSVAFTQIKDRLMGLSACFPSARPHSRPPGLQNKRWRWGFKKTCLSSTCFGRSEQGTGFGETAGAHMTIPRIVFAHLDPVPAVLKVLTGVLTNEVWSRR